MAAVWHDKPTQRGGKLAALCLASDITKAALRLLYVFRLNPLSFIVMICQMNKREAARILGIRASADKTKLMERYRTLMKNNHPDSGGSPYLAKKINEAKDLLVKGKSGKLAS